jgi:uncharacterized membrane protein YdjX (TVP38/TMEM64 family)
MSPQTPDDSRERERSLRRGTKIGIAAALLVVLIALGALAVWRWRDDAAAVMNYAASDDIHPAVFLVLFVVLPLVGFPISALLVLTGVKFGAWLGVLIMAAVMPVHLALAFLLANSFLRAVIERWLEQMAYRLPRVPEHRTAWFSFVFMAVPGLSYTLKNYVLALSGVPFRHFFLSGFLVQGTMGVPFVVAGDAAVGRDLLLLAAVVLLLACAYGGIYLFRKRHGPSGKQDEDDG